MPKSAYASSPWPSPRRIAWPSSKTGSIQWWIRLSPSGSPRNMPRKIDGIDSRMSGMVMTGTDSWILSQISFGPRNEPQNVMPINRNM